MTVRNLVIVALSSLLLTACHQGLMYSSFQSVEMSGWQMDSLLRFDIPVTEPAMPHDIILHVRHTDAYPYQNMWLFINDGHKTDTIEFYLADDRGQWLGNGHAIKDMPVLYRQQYQFTDSLYHLTIQQGMRDVLLPGVSEIGVEVVR